MLHKILHNSNHPFYCKFLQFAKLVGITPHRAQQFDKAFASIRYNTYQISRCFICYTTRFWNSLPNLAVLVVKQDSFIALAKKFM